jgi:AcrR family transcriptional regulator
MSRDPSMRSDARNNRDRLLEVARDVLATDPRASLHSIAKAAGVGQGTLYRHFPTREALVLGVYRDGIDALVGLAPTLLAETAPLRALRLWCEYFAEYSRKKHGIADMVKAAMSEQDFAETYWPMVDAARLLMTACAESGELSDPIDPEDFLQLLALLMQLPPTAEGKARSERLLSFVLQGMGASHHQ